MERNQYLIVGANFINKGAEAMLKTVKQFILLHDPEAQIFAICHAQEAEIARKQDVEPLFMPPAPNGQTVQKLLMRVVGKLGRMLGKPAKPFADYSPMHEIVKLRHLKLAVDVSGFAYGDKRGYIQPLETLKVIEYCKSVKARFVFMPQAWGGFNDPMVAANCRKIMLSADTWCVRDDVSKNFVARLLDVDPAQIPVYPDIAFHFPDPPNQGKELLIRNAYQPGSGKPLVGFSPNMRIYERMEGSGVANAYVRLFLELIEAVRDRYDVVLIPNEIMPPGMGMKDDQFLCRTIFEALENKQGVCCISGYYSAEEIKSILQECQMVVASRFHTLVFSLSMAIPSMAISWSHKYRELFRLFGLEDFVLEDTGVDNASIIRKFGEMEARHREMCDRLKQKLPEIRYANARVFEYLKVPKS